MEINAYDKKSKKILIQLVKYDKYNGGNVFESWKERKEFKKHIKHGGMSSFALFELIGLYGHLLSNEDREYIEYLYAQAINGEFNETNLRKP